MSTNDSFLSRWSRLKRTRPEPATATVPGAVHGVVQDAPPSTAPASAIDPAAEGTLDRLTPADSLPDALPDTATLMLDSDFTAFLKEEVGDALRRQALKKLFNDPHFNVMDGLDIYIDDYSVPEPIPPEMLAKLRSASEWLAGRDEDATDATPTVAESDTRVADEIRPPDAEGKLPGGDPAPGPASGSDEGLDAPVEEPPNPATEGNGPGR